MNDAKIEYASVSELYSTSSMNEWGIGMMIQQWKTKVEYACHWAENSPDAFLWMKTSEWKNT